MKTSEELNSIESIKVNLRRLFAIKTNKQQSDSSTTEAPLNTRRTKLDWFQQIHGIGDNGTAG